MDCFSYNQSVAKAMHICYRKLLNVNDSWYQLNIRTKIGSFEWPGSIYQADKGQKFPK